jgi:GTP-binding protein HflX
VLVSDTVGFIRNLPTTLIRAFRATLEEVIESELLLHVVDASSPSAEEQTAHVLATLNEISAGETPQILVLNKIDLVPGEPDTSALARRILGDPEHQPAGAVAISAATGQGFQDLLRKIDQTLAVDPLAECAFRFPVGEGAPLHLLHEHARVLSTRYNSKYCYVDAVAPASLRRRLRRYAVAKR